MSCLAGPLAGRVATRRTSPSAELLKPKLHHPLPPVLFEGGHVVDFEHALQHRGGIVFKTVAHAGGSKVVVFFGSSRGLRRSRSPGYPGVQAKQKARVGDRSTRALARMGIGGRGTIRRETVSVRSRSNPAIRTRCGLSSVLRSVPDIGSRRAVQRLIPCTGRIVAAQHPLRRAGFCSGRSHACSCTSRRRVSVRRVRLLSGPTVGSSPSMMTDRASAASARGRSTRRRLRRMTRPAKGGVGCVVTQLVCAGRDVAPSSAPDR